MKSKCYFDLNGQDESVIVAEFAKSNDVRDKVAQRFREALLDSSLALVRRLPDKTVPALQREGEYDPTIKVLEIVTIAGKEGSIAELCRSLSTRQLEMLQDMIPKVLKERVKSTKK